MESFQLRSTCLTNTLDRRVLHFKFQESDSVLDAGGGQEVENLTVDVLGAGQILVYLDRCLDLSLKILATSYNHPNSDMDIIANVCRQLKIKPQLLPTMNKHP